MENVLHAVALLLPSLTHSASPGWPSYLPPQARPQLQGDVVSSARDEPTSGRDGGRVRQWKNVLNLLINIAVLPGEN